MAIAQDFTSSYHALLKNKILILPKLIGSAISIALVLIFLFLSGIIGFVYEYNTLVEKYKEENKNPLKQNKEDLKKYLKDHGFEGSEFLGLLNVRNAVLAVVLVLLIVIFSYYLRAVSLVMISMVVMKKKLQSSSIMKLTNRLFFKLIYIYILISLIILVPLILGIAGVVFFFYISKVLGVLSIIAVILLFIAYVIFITVKLIFMIPILFLEEMNVHASIKQSYTVTKRNFKDAFIVWAVIVGISIAFGFFGNAIQGSFSGLLAFQNALKFVFSLAVLALFYILSAAVDTFSYLFLLYSYVDFNKNVAKNAKIK